MHLQLRLIFLAVEGRWGSGKISFHIRAETSPQQAATICLSIKGKLGMVLAGFTLLVLILELVGFRQIGRMGSDLLNAIQTYYPKTKRRSWKSTASALPSPEPQWLDLIERICLRLRKISDYHSIRSSIHPA